MAPSIALCRQQQRNGRIYSQMNKLEGCVGIDGEQGDRIQYENRMEKDKLTTERRNDD
jgi:hypothetical protein